jgi:hypothetical protein
MMIVDVSHMPLVGSRGLRQGQPQKRKGPRSGGVERGPTERSSRWRAKTYMASNRGESRNWMSWPQEFK